MNSVVQINNEGSVSTYDIFEKLGYKEHRKLKEVINKNKNDFDRLGTLNTLSGETTSVGGRPPEAYLLNLNQLLLLVTISKNKNLSVKVSVIRAIIDGYSNANLLSISNLIANIDIEDLPKDRFVYVARENESGRYKIGISRDPERRVMELNTGNPESLILVHAYLANDKGYKSEALAHAIFEENRIRSEWFTGDIDISKLPSYRAK